MEARSPIRPSAWTAPLLGVVMALAVGLAGCGSDSDGPASPGSATTATTPPPAPPRTVNVDDDAELARLASEFGVDFQPYVHAQTRAVSTAPAILMWPQKDVRKEGLRSFALELNDGAYDGTGYLTFKKGSKVLWQSEEPYDPPAGATSTGQIPDKVLQSVDVGDTVTWGLYFKERGRKEVKAEFRIVDRDDKVQKQEERIRKDRTLDAMSREILLATALENYRLYSEALVRNLEIAAAYPESVRPFEGILTNLQRLHLQETTLWGAISPFITGKGMARAGGLRGPGTPGIGAIELHLPPGVRPLGPEIARVDPPTGDPATGDGFKTGTPGVQGNGKPATSDAGTPSAEGGEPGDPGTRVDGDRSAEEMARRASGLAGTAAEAEALWRQLQQDAEAMQAAQGQKETELNAANEAVQAAEAALEAAIKQAEGPYDDTDEGRKQQAHDAYAARQAALALADLQKAAVEVAKQLMDVREATSTERQKMIEAQAAAAEARMIAEQARLEAESWKNRGGPGAPGVGGPLNPDRERDLSEKRQKLEGQLGQLSTQMAEAQKNWTVMSQVVGPRRDAFEAAVEKVKNTDYPDTDAGEQARAHDMYAMEQAREAYETAMATMLTAQQTIHVLEQQIAEIKAMLPPTSPKPR